MATKKVIIPPDDFHRNLVLVPTQAGSARTLKMLDKSVAALKKGLASDPVGLSVFNQD